MLIWLALSILLVGVDQLIKYFVVQNIALTDTIGVIPNILNLIFVKNTGAAFSILSGKTYFLSIISTVVCLFIIWYLVRKNPKNKLLTASLSIILGGAAGNLVDRAFRHYVVDYLEIDFMKFPIFNFADIAISVGAVLLMIYVLFFDNREMKE